MSRASVRVWTASIAALDGANNPVSLLFADGAFVDDEAFFYEPRMKQPALMRVMANAGDLLPSLGRSSIGELELVNADGGLNHLADYAMDGRECVITLWDNGSPSEYFRGTVSNVRERGNSFTFTLRPGSQTLEQPYPMTLYQGDNVLPNGVEGVDDIAGRPKPIVWGRVDNGAPALVNTALLIYQVSEQPCVVVRVRDKGVELTRGADYVDLAEMQATAPAPGEVRCYQGWFRLGSSPGGTVTCDATAGTAAERKAGSLLSSLLTGAGAALCPTCAATLDGISGECGFFLAEETAVSQLLDRFAEALGAYWYFADGVIKFGLLQAPAGGGQALQDWQVLSAERRALAAGGNGLPVSRVTIPHSEVSATQADLAGSASDELKARLATRWRQQQAESAATISRHPLAEPLTVQLGVSFAPLEVKTVCQRLLDLLSVRRDLVTVDVQIDALGPVTIGDQLTLHTRRLGYNQGRDMICLGYELNAKRNRITLELFG